VRGNMKKRGERGGGDVPEPCLCAGRNGNYEEKKKKKKRSSRLC